MFLHCQRREDLTNKNPASLYKVVGGVFRGYILRNYISVRNQNAIPLDWVVYIDFHHDKHHRLPFVRRICTDRKICGHVYLRLHQKQFLPQQLL